VPTLAVAALLGLAALTGAADEPGFVPIFNGKDLTGWEGDQALWSVQDGAITGTTTDEKRLPYNKFLIWRGGKPGNFELKAKVRLAGNSNSGIQYRSTHLTSAGEFVVGGYQMDIHPSPNYNGMLYDERGRGILAQVGQKVVIAENGDTFTSPFAHKPSPVKLDEWNDYSIVARGNHLVHAINGQTTVDVIDHQASERELDGIIAFQVHVGPAMKVQFKEIVLKTLPEGGLLSPDQAPAPADAVRKAAPAAKGKAKAKDQAQEVPKAKAKGQGRNVVSGPAPKNQPADRLKVSPGFKVELVHDVERDGEGSWVSMTIDPKHRLIVSDQYGKLFRVTPSPVGGPASATKVEPINVDIGEAQGLLWAFDSLYVVVNRGQKYPSGLYRARDTNGDDALDTVEMLRRIEGGGEHGPHGVVLSPDGKSLHVVAGNATQLPTLSASLVPEVWGEDNLLPRMVDGSGFMKTEKAPGGWVCKVDPDGKNWELVSMGYRNAYDIAFNRSGELFTYDSDMEWDFSTPWYRPTRVCHAVSGSEFGYRNGAGKWPVYSFDSLPPVVDIGPGSPTGVTFGYGAKFPAKYQEALYICDWSYGKLYAVHLRPRGASYVGEIEEFIAGTPLPLTDIVVNPKDGAMYFAIGGRRTTSGLYRVVYNGPEPTAAPTEPNTPNEARALRHKLEAFHGHADPGAVATAWPYLGHPDRFVRWAARVAIEFQNIDSWRDRALEETDPDRAIPALLALTHVSARDPAHRRPTDPAPDAALKTRILEALDRIGGQALADARKLDLLRLYQVVFVRFGAPDPATASRLVARFDPWYPAGRRDLNTELSQVLVYLGAPDAASKTVALLEKAPTQEEQIEYARSLRVLKTGWTPELRKAYFSWFLKAAGFKGGNSFRGFMRNIRDDATATLSESEKADLKPILDAVPKAQQTQTVALPLRAHVKSWTMEELVPLVDSGLKGRDFDRGRTLFAAAACFSCHRFNNEGGGAGPDLSGLAGRFTTRDLLESIVLPSKVISDQYGAVMFSTVDGQVVTGRIMNLHGDTIMVNTNMLDPSAQVGIDRRRVDEMKPSPVSMMPEGLLNTLNKDEVLDLVAYLLSRGDRDNGMFK
jgi:putative heme-binding domain-containing protein